MKQMFQTASVLTLALTSTVLAGARIDLRPASLGPYSPQQNVRVDAFLVDTGNPQGNINFRGLFLDFTDTEATLTFPGEDLSPGNSDDNLFIWENPNGLGTPFPFLPRTAWVFPFLQANPPGQITLPNNGEVHMGYTFVNVGDAGQHVLDVMNDDVENPNFGARADFGFGGAGDPLVVWRAFNGQLTGGTLNINVVPEPVSLILLGFASVMFARRR